MGDWEDIADDWENLDEGDDSKLAPWEKEDNNAPANWDDEDEEDEGADVDPFGAVSVARGEPKKAKSGAAGAGGKKKKVKAANIKKKNLNKKLNTNDVKVDPFEEKLRKLQLQQESDLANANDLLGVGADEVVVNTSATTPAAQFKPTTELEFLKFSSMIADDLSKFEENKFYEKFVIDLVRKLAGQMNSAQINSIISALNVQFKQKLQDEKGKKKKTTKAKVYDDDFAADDFVEDELDGFL